MPLFRETNRTYLLILLSQNFAAPEKVLENTGLDAASLALKDAVDFATVRQVMRNLDRYSADALWPVRLGARIGVTGHGSVGFAALSADTLGQAVSTFLDWEQIRAPWYTGEIVETELFMEILIRDAMRDPDFQRVFFQMFTASLETLLSTITRAPCHGASEIHFLDDFGDTESLLRDAFESTLLFGTPANKVRIPKHWWNLVSPLRDPEAHAVNLQKCEQILAERTRSPAPDFVVKTLLRQHFETNLSGHSLPTPPPGLAAMATKMHMSERTLIRRLEALGTSYKSILETTRKDLAARLLAQGRYAVADVGDLLGYQASANFCRAFRSWYGMSPSQFRKTC